MRAEDLGADDGVVVIDGSRFPKQGRHSVGVARQYCGHLDQVANWQHAVFAASRTAKGHAVLDRRLYMPEGGFDDAERAAIRAHTQARAISLGPRILRGETAAIAATALWMGVAGDWRK